jgi:hypothetical protein
VLSHDKMGPVAATNGLQQVEALARREEIRMNELSLESLGGWTLVGVPCTACHPHDSDYCPRVGDTGR